MAKSTTMYVCSECGSEFFQWQGQCTSCHVWNSLKSIRVSGSSKNIGKRLSATKTNTASVSLNSIEANESDRIVTFAGELNRVLGGGFVPGSVVLIGGHPGAGKSTLLLEVVADLARHMNVLYVSGEESAEQLALRAARLGYKESDMRILIETSVDTVMDVLIAEKPRMVVIDSVQMLHSDDVSGSPGGVSQVRECVTRLTRLVKTGDTTLILVGHVTKDGSLAGPKVLEHCVDCSISMDTSTDSRFRTLRAMKNRFGTVNELGIFAMTESGLKEVRNPSAMFLTGERDKKPGTIVTVIWEGTRPILLEIQTLVDESGNAGSRRLTLGIDSNRLIILLAVLHKHTGISLAGQDVFANIVGGIRITETSADVALMLAVVSSLRNKPFPTGLLAFGEIGLSGEIRPVAYGQERIKEAVKHGFTKIIVPKANAPKKAPANIEIIAASNLLEALELLLQID